MRRAQKNEVQSIWLENESKGIIYFAAGVSKTFIFIFYFCEFPGKYFARRGERTTICDWVRQPRHWFNVGRNMGTAILDNPVLPCVENEFPSAFFIGFGRESFMHLTAQKCSQLVQVEQMPVCHSCRWRVGRKTGLKMLRRKKKNEWLVCLSACHLYENVKCNSSVITEF